MQLNLQLLQNVHTTIVDKNDIINFFNLAYM